MSVEEVGGCGEEAERGQESAEGVGWWGGGGIGDRLCTVWVVQHVGTSTATISNLANSPHHSPTPHSSRRLAAR
jgi:hypothetical protein